MSIEQVSPEEAARRFRIWRMTHRPSASVSALADEVKIPGLRVQRALAQRDNLLEYTDHIMHFLDAFERGDTLALKRLRDGNVPKTLPPAHTRNIYPPGVWEAITLRQRKIVCDSVRPHCLIVRKNITVRRCVGIQNARDCYGCAAETRFCAECAFDKIVFPGCELCEVCLTQAMKNLATDEVASQWVTHVACSLSQSQEIAVRTCRRMQSEQCGGCDAVTRVCLNCKERRVRYPDFGLCLRCHAELFNPLWEPLGDEELTMLMETRRVFIEDAAAVIQVKTSNPETKEPQNSANEIETALKEPAGAVMPPSGMFTRAQVICLLSDYVETLHRQGKQQRTTNSYCKHVERFVEWAGGGELFEPRTVDGPAIEQFLNTVGSRKPSISMLNAIISALRSFFSYLATKGIVEENPAYMVERPTLEKSKFKPPSEKEFQRMLDAVETHCPPEFKSRNIAIMVVIHHCGLRLSEAVALDVDQVDLENQILREAAKFGHQDWRSVKFGHAVAAALRRCLDDRAHLHPFSHERALFISRERSRLGHISIQQIIRRFARSAGIVRKMNASGLRKKRRCSNCGNDVDSVDGVMVANPFPHLVRLICKCGFAINVDPEVSGATAIRCETCGQLFQLTEELA